MKYFKLNKIATSGFTIFILILFSFSIKADEKETNVYQQLNMFGEVYERIRREYVEEVDDKELIEAAIQGMLQSLDPHSSFMNSESFDDMQLKLVENLVGLVLKLIWKMVLLKLYHP